MDLKIVDAFPVKGAREILIATGYVTCSIRNFELRTVLCQCDSAVAAARFRPVIRRPGQALEITTCSTMRDRRRIRGSSSLNWRRNLKLSSF